MNLGIGLSTGKTVELRFHSTAKTIMSEDNRNFTIGTAFQQTKIIQTRLRTSKSWRAFCWTAETQNYVVLRFLPQRYYCDNTTSSEQELGQHVLELMYWWLEKAAFHHVNTNSSTGPRVRPPAIDHRVIELCYQPNKDKNYS